MQEKKQEATEQKSFLRGPWLSRLIILACLVYIAIIRWQLSIYHPREIVLQKPTPVSHWQTVYCSKPDGSDFEGIDDVYIADPNLVWLAMPGRRNKPSYMLQTRDSGQTWNRSSVPYCTMVWANGKVGWSIESILRGISSAPETHFTRTIDGGQTWQSISPKYTPIHFKAISALDGWGDDFDFGLGRERINQTKDGGKTWKALSINWPANRDMHFGDFTFADSLHGWIVATITKKAVDQRPEKPEDFKEQLVIFRTENGGKSFQQVTIPTIPKEADAPTPSPQNLRCYGKKHAWLNFLLSNYLLHTADGGLTWEVVSTHLDARSFIDDILLFSDKEIWGVGSSPRGLVVIKSTDAGRTWEKVITGAENLGYHVETHACALDRNHIWIGGNAGETAPIDVDKELRMAFVIKYVP
jgi:photosystem II stability/assembly factor-like uncharacterized protein